MWLLSKSYHEIYLQNGKKKPQTIYTYSQTYLCKLSGNISVAQDLELPLWSSVTLRNAQQIFPAGYVAKVLCYRFNQQSNKIRCEDHHQKPEPNQHFTYYQQSFSLQA